MMTNAAATGLYHEFNRLYFRNKLPHDMVVEYTRLQHEFGITVGHKGRPLYIQLDWPLRKSLAMTAMTLLHEMVHVEDMRFGHGPRFHKRMLQLAKAGAMKKWW